MKVQSTSLYTVEKQEKSGIASVFRSANGDETVYQTKAPYWYRVDWRKHPPEKGITSAFSAPTLDLTGA